MSQRFKTVYFPERDGSASDRDSLTIAFGTRDSAIYDQGAPDRQPRAARAAGAS